MDELDRLYRRLVQNIRGAAPEMLTRPFEVSQIYQELVPYRTNRRELGFDSNEDYELALMQLLAGLRGYLVVDSELQSAMRAELSSPNPDLATFRVYATSTVALAQDPLRALEQQTVQQRSAGVAPGTPHAAASEAAALAARATEAFEATPSAPRAVPQPPRPAQSPAATAPRPVAPAAPRPATQPMPRPVAPPPPSAATHAAPRYAPALEPLGARAPRANPDEHGVSCRYCSGTLPDGRKVTFCPHCGHNLTVQHCPACGTELEVEWKFCITCGRDTLS